MNEREANRIKDIIYYDEEHESFDAPMDEDVCARCKYRRVCQVLNDYKRDDGFEEAMLSLIEDEDPYTDCPKTLDQVIDYLETAQNRFDFVYERNELARDSEEIQSGVVLLDKSIWSYVKKTDTDFRESADTANSTKDFLRFLP